MRVPPKRDSSNTDTQASNVKTFKRNTSKVGRNDPCPFYLDPCLKIENTTLPTSVTLNYNIAYQIRLMA